MLYRTRRCRIVQLYYALAARSEREGMHKQVRSWLDFSVAGRALSNSLVRDDLGLVIYYTPSILITTIYSPTGQSVALQSISDLFSRMRQCGNVSAEHDGPRRRLLIKKTMLDIPTNVYSHRRPRSDRHCFCLLDANLRSLPRRRHFAIKAVKCHAPWQTATGTRSWTRPSVSFLS